MIGPFPESSIMSSLLIVAGMGIQTKQQLAMK
jgi:hypothetical protein